MAVERDLRSAQAASTAATRLFASLTARKNASMTVVCAFGRGQRSDKFKFFLKSIVLPPINSRK